MGQVKAPNIQKPKTGITAFESKLVDLLFMATKTEELPVERLFDVAKVVAKGLLKDAKEGVGDHGEFVVFKDGTTIDLDPAMQLKPAFDIKEGEKVRVLIINEE